MHSFKQFVEDTENMLVPSAGEPLPSFLQRFKGSTIKQILDKSSFINLYFMNKHGIGGATDGTDKAIQDFSNALVTFINRDEQGNGPRNFRPRIYDSEEFKAKHNYDEYQKLEKERRLAILATMKSRKSSDPNALANAEKEKEDIADKLYSTEYWKAYQQARDDEDEYVENLHNTPLSSDQLSDDGSEEYKNLEQSYTRVMDFV
jgi:hypothetical protein